MKQHLPLHHHVLNVCGLAACWVLMCWAAMVLKPTRHGAQSSFHAGMPVAEQLGRLPSATSIEFFDAVFNSRCAAPRRSQRLRPHSNRASCRAVRRSRQKGTLLVSPSPVRLLFFQCARLLAPRLPTRSLGLEPWQQSQGKHAAYRKERAPASGESKNYFLH